MIYVCTAKGGAAMNTLEDLYYGNLFPHEKCARLDNEVKELLKLLNRNEEKLTATLTEAQKETFEKYTRTAIVRFLKSVSKRHS